MTELYREYRRCGKCGWFNRRWEGGPIYVGHIRCRGRNPGWFRCRNWISLKRIALALLETTQRRIKE